MALCGLLLGLLVSTEVSEFDLSQVSFLSSFPTSKVLPKNLVIMVSTANGPRDVVTQYQLSFPQQTGRCGQSYYSFIGFSFGVFSIYSYSIHIHSSKHFICSQSTLLRIYLIITSPCSYYYIYITTVTSSHVHH